MRYQAFEENCRDHPAVPENPVVSERLQAKPRLSPANELDSS
jgi:hypothetical protein